MPDRRGAGASLDKLTRTARSADAVSRSSSVTTPTTPGSLSFRGTTSAPVGKRATLLHLDRGDGTS